MPVFAYKALEENASAVRGLIVADTPRDARDSLRARGLTVENVSLRRNGASSTGIRGIFHRGARRDAARTNEFIRELATLLGVGIPLVEAIDTIQSQYRDRF